MILGLLLRIYLLCLSYNRQLPKPSTEGKAIGIDLGLAYFAITSDGSKFDHPKWIAQHESNLKIKQQMKRLKNLIQKS